MSTQAILRVLLVPAFILLITALYWFSIQGAASAAKRVPNVVMAFIVIMAAMELMREMARLTGPSRKRITSDEDTLADTLHHWISTHRQRLVFIAISLAYFPVFISLGFDIANFLFLALALPLSGLSRERSRGFRAGLSLSISLLAMLVFRMLAHVMDFNVPVSPFGF